MFMFVCQKVFFMAMTWHEGTDLMDIPVVVWHGLKLDIAVTCYTLTIPWLLTLVLPEFKYRNIVLRTIFILLSILIATIIVVDSSLYPFWQFKLDASIFLYTDKPKDAMASVSVWFILYRLFWFVLWVLFILKTAQWSRLFSESKESVESGSAKEVLQHILATILSAGLIVLAIRGGVGEGTNNVSAAYYSDNQYLNHCAVNPVFSLLYSMGKQQDFASEYQFFEEEERAEIMKGIYHTESLDSDTLLNTTRPDIILIVWEGLCEQMVGAVGGDPRITPNLNALAKESILFTNLYANSFRTDRGLVSIMAGYIGLTNASLMKIPEKNEHLPALPRSLADNGYATTFWYSGDISFTNMGGYMHQAGFKTTVSDKDFTLKERTSQWGAPDEYLVGKVLKGIESVPSDKAPQFHAVMTLSSHEPWDVPTNRLKEEIPNAFNYTDGCLGKFISGLKKTHNWNKTLVVITGDHGVLAKTSDTRYGHGTIHMPMLWLGGAIKNPAVIGTLMNQSDIAATLLGQLGISHDEFTFSRDVMSKGYTYPTATHSYANGVTFIDSTGATTYDCDAGKSIAGHDSIREQKAKATLQTLYRKVSEL